MKDQLLARVVFAISPLVFALAAWASPAAAGWAALAVFIPLSIVLRLRYPGTISTVLGSRRLLLLGASFALVNCLLIIALAIAPVPVVVILSTLGSVVGIILAPWFGQKAARLDLLAIPIGIAGTALVVLGAPADIPALIWPIMLAEVFFLALAMHLFAAIKNSELYSGREAILALQIPSLLLLLFLPLNLPPPSALGLIFVGGWLLAFGNLLLYRSFRQVPAHRSLILKPLSTIIAALLGVILLSDPWSWSLAWGGVLIIVSSLITGLANSRERVAGE